MRNVYLVQTETKRAKLQQDRDNGTLSIWDKPCVHNAQDFVGVNLYITSEEEVRENEWCLDQDSTLFQNGNNPVSNTADYYGSMKKIILTTDEDLIAKGVQSIDEEFLQWFVKNPTCTKVEVDVVIVKPHYPYPGDRINHYNIIMPKKPETFAELFANTDINTTKDANGNTHYHFKAIKKDNPPPAWLDIKEVNMLQEYKAVKKKAYCKYCLSTTNCCDDIEAETCEDYLKSSDSIIKKAAEKLAIEEWEDLYSHTKLTGAERSWETITNFIAGAKSDAAKNYWFEQFEKK